MEIVTGLCVVVGFMMLVAIAIGACGERFDRRKSDKNIVDTENHYFN